MGGREAYWRVGCRRRISQPKIQCEQGKNENPKKLCRKKSYNLFRKTNLEFILKKNKSKKLVLILFIKNDKINR